MAVHARFDVLKTATKIALIFVAIVAVFTLASNREWSDETVAAETEMVLEQPVEPKRALSSLAPKGAAAAVIVTGMVRV